jgi:hypothetical protein
MFELRGRITDLVAAELLPVPSDDSGYVGRDGSLMVPCLKSGPWRERLSIRRPVRARAWPWTGRQDQLYVDRSQAQARLLGA